MLARLVIMIACAPALASCATVVRGTKEPMTFTSEPSGAEVTTTAGYACVTPCTVEIPRNKDFVATYKKVGYEPTTIDVTTSISGAGATGLVGNAIVGGIIGVGVDTVSGATLDHRPNPAHAILYPEKHETGAGPRISKKTKKATKAAS